MDTPANGGGASVFASPNLNLGPSTMGGFIATPTETAASSTGGNAYHSYQKPNLNKPAIINATGINVISTPSNPSYTTYYPSGVRFGQPSANNIKINRISSAFLLPNKKTTMISHSENLIHIFDPTKGTFYLDNTTNLSTTPVTFYKGSDFFRKCAYNAATSKVSSFTSLTGKKVGKTIMVASSIGASTTPIAYELLSVKGYYKDVSEFDLIDELKDDIETTNLSTLLAGNYNFYFNQPVRGVDVFC